MRASVVLGLGLVLGCGTEVQRCGPNRATVERVIDGDTVELGGGLRVRYLSIDAPEVGSNAECFGPEAEAQNAALVDGEPVTLEYDDRCEDDFGRLLAYLYLGERMINEVLLERGFARFASIPPNDAHDARLRAAEQSARDTSAGLWGACR